MRDRQPKVLLVNIGSNEGLFRAAFLGAFDPQTLNSVAAIPQKMEPLAEQLASLPSAVETIAFNSLVRPRTAPNLMPGSNPRGIYPGDGYFSSYGPWIISEAGTIPGETLRQFDQMTAEVNERVRVLMANKLGARFKFVDLYAASTSLDGKHYQNRPLVVHSRSGKALRASEHSAYAATVRPGGVRVVALTCADPPQEATHWTGRAMAKAADISLRSVQRIWEAHRLQPHRVGVGARTPSRPPVSG